MPDTAAKQQIFRATITRFMIVGFTALVGVVISTGVLMGMNQRQIRWINHTYETQREIATIRLTVTELISVKLRDRHHETPQGVAQAAMLQSALDTSIGRLTALTRDNPRQQARIPLLLASAAQIERQAGLDVPLGAVADVRDDPGAMVAALCKAMQAEESQLLVIRNGRLSEIGKGFFGILGLTGVLLSVVAALTYTTLASYTRELVASRRALAASNTGLEAAVQERTTELLRANGEIQRFVYIVSHDLRSPLVNIMGFTAELENATRVLQDELRKVEVNHPEVDVRITKATITEEMPEAIHFIRTSTQKMDRLINAILRLSRLGRRTLTPEWLELEPLCRSVADTMQVLINQTGATVEIESPMPELYGDRVGLEQMLANLIENAIKYRQPGRALCIRLSARRQGSLVAIAVADNGRGIESRDKERVFDLFRRAGVQDQPGEGIGLAHVRAMAYRMGGTIGLESSLGEGSTFTINLPYSFQEDQGAQA